MKKNLNLAILLCLALGATSVRAATVYWDINGATAGAGGATPSGNWGIGTATWGNSGGTIAGANWVDGDTAVLSAGTDATGSYTLTVNTPITVAGITREEGTPTISAVVANTFTFASGALAVDTGTGTLILNAFYAPANGVVTKTGTGIFSPGTSQTSFQGKWICNAGSLSFAGDTRIGIVPGSLVADQVTLNGSSARLRSSTASVSFNANRGITLGASGGGFDHAGTVTLTWAGPITGSSGGGLTMSGAGVLILSSTANNYDGPTTISAGTLQCGASGVIPDTSLVTLVAGTSLTLNGFNETVKSISGSGGTVALGGNTLTIDNPTGEAFGAGGAGIITGTTGGKVVKNGSGAWSIGGTSGSGVHTYSGGLTLNAGTLGVGAASSLGTGTTTVNNSPKLCNNTTGGKTFAVPMILNGDLTFDDSLNSNPGTLVWSGATATWQIKGATRTITVNPANYTVTIGNASAIISGDLVGNGLTKAGAGILALGTAAHTFTGPITLNGGALQVGSTGTYGAGSQTITLNASGVELQLAANKTSANPINNPIAVAADSTLDTGGTTTATDRGAEYAGALSWTAGTLSLRNPAGSAAASHYYPKFTAAFSYPGNVVIGQTEAGGGLVVLGSYNTSGDQTWSGTLSGIGAVDRGTLVAGAAGRTIFSAAAGNTYSGGTTITNGTLLVNNTSGSGTGSGSVTVSGSGILGGTGIISGAVTVGAGGTLAPGTSIGTLTFGSSLALSGTTSMEINKTLGAADKIVMSSGTVTLGGNLSVVNLAGTLALNDTFDLIDGTIAGAFASFTLPALPAGLAWDTSQLTAGGNGTIKVVCGGTLVASAGANQTICSGSSVGIGGSPTASGGSGSGYTYLWSPATGLNDATLANPTASPSSTTAYTVTVTDGIGCTAISPSVTVTVNTAPSVSSGPTPSSQAVCEGSAASFTVSASGGSLNYTWRKLGTGWGAGNQWQLSGAGGNGGFFIGDSANNGSGSSGNINTSGKAWGMYANGGNVVAAVRSFTGTGLAVGQTFQIDMDNGFIDNGSSVGFGLQNSSGENVWEFYFVGGGSSYAINAGSVAPAPSIPFTGDGLRIAFALTASGTYTVTITTPVGGSSSTFTGSLLSPGGGQTITQLRLFNANAGNGSANDAYFNSIIAGAYDDNAANYTAWNNSDNFGDSPLSNGGNIAGANTATLTISPAGAGDSGSYDVVAYNSCGQASPSGAATLTLNPRPTAVVSGGGIICPSGSANIQAALTGTGPWDVTWSDAFVQTGVSSSPATRTVSPGSTTIYTVTALTDSNCTAQAGDLTGSATVTVQDTSPPTITCPPDVTDIPTDPGQCYATGVNLGVPSATNDNCGILTVTNNAPATFPHGNTVVTWTAVDTSGNTATCAQNVTVVDHETPFINCGQNETVSCLQGWGFTVPIVTDNCDAGLVPLALSTVTNFGCGYTFVATRIWQVTDTSSNVTYCTQVVSYVDFIPPTITQCAADVTVQCLTDIPAPDVSSVTATNTFDPCETNVPVVTHFSDVTNGVSPNLIITRTYHATDACGNFTQCQQTITVHDSTPPIITCVAGKTVECGSVWTFDEPTASDACCGTNVAITILSTATNGTGCSLVITQTWQATDCNSNSATCSQIVTVVDTTAPVITCATNKTVECGSAWTFDEPGALDTCSGTNVTISVLSTLTNGAGCSLNITRTWQATDPCTNNSTCSQTVTIVDTTAPVLTCATNKTVECGSAWTFDEPSALDACSGTNLTIVSLGTVTNGVGCSVDITRTWQATDLCTNSSTCSQTVTIVDTTAPVLTCATNKTVECGSVWSFDDPSALDACSGTNVTISVLSTLTNGVGCSLNITRTWQATDPCTNNSTCSQTVTIVDTTAPVLTCVPDKAVGCAAVWAFDEPGALDACSGTNVTISVLNTVTNNTSPKVITRTWEATDSCTNIATCSQSVTLTNSCTSPAISDLSYSGTTFTFSFLSQAGFAYDVEYKDSLDDPSWSLLESDAGTGAIINVTDATAAPATRFYRVVCRCQ